MLDGVDGIIDRWLGLDKSGSGTEPRYKHKKNLQQLLRSLEELQSLDGGELVSNLLEQITINWKENKRKPSSENWRFNKQPYFDPRSRSLEKTLEKSTVIVTDDSWANQVPVAAGLVHSGEGKRAIDLVHKKAHDTFEFIELKIDEKSGGPLFAAMEILLYGLIYVFSRENIKDLGYDPKKILFAANRIELQVLAPAGYYKGYELGWLERTLSSGLSSLKNGRDFGISFAFRVFPDEFEWNLWSLKLLDALDHIGGVTR